MTLLIKNISKLYSPDVFGGYGAVQETENVSVMIHGENISAIGDAREIDTSDADQVIDASGLCMLPGFVDAHTHPVFWNTREAEFIMRIGGRSYEEIAAAGGGIRNSARNFQKAPYDEIKQRTRIRLRQFLVHGTTTIEAKSGYGLTKTDELRSLKIIQELNSEQPLEMVPTFLGAHEIPDEYRNNRSEYIRIINEEMIPEVAGQKLAEFCDVFCEKGVFDIEETREIMLQAKKFGLNPRLHADELHAFGAAELAAEIQAITADHLVKVSKAGIRQMADRGVIPVLLPVTTFFLRKEEYSPARAMIDAGCQIALATDFNPGSSMTQNMQMVWSIGALKLGLLPGELLWATTIVPAKTLFREKRIGSIEIGKQADLSLMSIPNLEYLPYHLAVNHILLVIKKGRIIINRSETYPEGNKYGQVAIQD